MLKHNLQILAAVAFASLWTVWARAADSEQRIDSKKASTETDKGPKFMRVLRDAHRPPKALETATGHYIRTINGKTVSVDLIGCIHIADKKYYSALNERFKNYDAVLFELVMPEKTGSLKSLRTRRSNNIIGQIQQSLPEVLDLSYQLAEIDYTAKNFVHADLSPDQMAKAIQSRGDNGASVFMKILFDVFNEAGKQSEARAKQGGDFTEIQLLAALFDPNRPLALKRLMADQMDLIGLGTGLGPTLDTILVKDRNGAALKVLSSELKKGASRIAIFYGAAHMPDFDRRLTQDLKFRRESLTWDRAWDLSGK